jgi:hypothetical protein
LRVQNVIVHLQGTDLHHIKFQRKGEGRIERESIAPAGLPYLHPTSVGAAPTAAGSQSGNIHRLNQRLYFY